MPDTFSIEIKGLDAAIRDLGALIRKLGPEVIGDALETELEIEKTKIVRVTPIEHGPLRGSITVDKAVISGKEIRCRIYAGGSAAGYALYVHENLQARHEAPTGAKFIERPLNEAVPDLANRITKRIASLAGV